MQNSVSQSVGERLFPHERVLWIDAARGGAIIFVVLGHAWRGMNEAGLIQDRGLFLAIDQAIYLFHMPVFFILSGLVFRQSRSRETVADFLRNLAVRLLYPLTLWYYIFVGVNFLMSPYVNSNYGLDRLLGLPVPFGTHLWFLWALLLIQVMALPVYFAQHKMVRMALVILGVVGSLFVKFGLGYFNLWLHHAITYLPFFLLGVFVADLRSLRQLSGWPIWQGMTLGILLFAGAELLRLSASPVHAGVLSLGCLAAIGFILLVQTARGHMANGLARLGRASMAIYLVHIFFTAGIRILLNQSEINNVFLHIFLGTVLG